jgi:hypothetical protein
MNDFGIVDAGVEATKVDLDIPTVPSVHIAKAVLSYFIWTSHAPGQDDLLAVITFQCPPWFEPTKRRLALNDLAWLDATCPVNNIDDFDPWSRSVLLSSRGMKAGYRGYLAL